MNEWNGASEAQLKPRRAKQQLSSFHFSLKKWRESFVCGSLAAAIEWRKFNWIWRMKMKLNWVSEWAAGGRGGLFNQLSISSINQSTQIKKVWFCWGWMEKKLLMVDERRPYFHSIHWFDLSSFPLRQNNQWISFQSLHKLGYFNSTWWLLCSNQTHYYLNTNHS